MGGCYFAAAISIGIGFLVAATMLTGAAGAILVAGGFSVVSMYLYVEAVGTISKAFDAGKLTEDEAAGAIKFLSLMTILSNAFSVAQALKKISKLTELSWAALITYYSLMMELIVDGIVWLRRE